MCKEKLAVNVISYIDDNKAKNLIGVANNIFRYVKESKIDGDFVHIIQQYPEGFTKQVFIPVNNVGLRLLIRKKNSTKHIQLKRINKGAE